MSYILSAAILTCMYRSEQRRLYIEDLEIAEQTKGARIQLIKKVSIEISRPFDSF